MFYKKFWSVVDKDVLRVVLGFLNGNGDITKLNKTILCFIPEIKNSRKVTEFLAISLCNLAYKLILKILTNRLW